MKFLMRGVAERCTETTDVAPTVAIPQSRERAEDWSRSPRGCSLLPHAAVGASIRSGSERVSVLVMVVISQASGAAPPALSRAYSLAPGWQPRPLTALSLTAAWIAGRATGSTGTNVCDHRWSWLSGLKGHVEEYWITLRSAERQRGAHMRRYAKDVCRTHGMEDAMA